jgi:hypothetical protein
VQFLDRFVDRGRVGEFGEDDEPPVAEWAQPSTIRFMVASMRETRS